MQAGVYPKERGGKVSGNGHPWAEAGKFAAQNRSAPRESVLARPLL
jgi:hypothetical protein